MHRHDRSINQNDYGKKNQSELSENSYHISWVCWQLEREQRSLSFRLSSHWHSLELAMQQCNVERNQIAICIAHIILTTSKIISFFGSNGSVVWRLRLCVSNVIAFRYTTLFGAVQAGVRLQMQNYLYLFLIYYFNIMFRCTKIFITNTATIFLLS